MNFEQLLISNWLYNLLNGEINEEILYLEDNFLSIDIEKSLNNLEIKNLELYKANLVTDINKLDINKNIIIIGTRIKKIYLLYNMKRTMLHFPTNINKTILNLLNDTTLINQTDKKEIKKELGIYYLRFYYQPIKPIKILLNIHHSEVNKYIFSFHYILENIYNFHYIIDNSSFGVDYSTIIKDDIRYLKKEYILTARLAIIIYKISTLNFEISNKEIGIYYRNKLKIKSKTIRLPKQFNSYKKHMPSFTLKAYDIKANKTLYFFIKHLVNKVIKSQNTKKFSNQKYKSY